MNADARRTAKILVVDDVALNVKLLADLLAVKGYRTCTRDLGRRGARACSRPSGPTSSCST